MQDRLIMGAPEAREALLRGIDLMTGLLRPTLGPAARTVAIDRIVGSDPPEVLDSAATIARRTIQLAYPFEDMGAMLIRQAVWIVFEAVGDGGATTAVLAQAIAHQAAKYIAAGGNAMMVRRGIEEALKVAIKELDGQARRISTPAQIAGVVSGILRDAALEQMVAEVMDSVGAEGAVLVEDAQGIETGHEYIDGIRWNEGYVSHFLLKEGQTECRIINPRIFITDHFLETTEQLLPVVEACLEAGEKSLLVIAPEVRDQALALLILNREKGVLDEVVAVKAPSIGTQRTRILEDIAAITGGRCLLQEAGDRFQDVLIQDLGQARQAWATRFAFGILGGTGAKGAIRQRINEARAELKTIKDDEYTTNKIKERIGKLAGAAAIIRVGAPTKTDQVERKFRIEAAVTAARAAMQNGVIAGGGAGLAAAGRAVERYADTLPGDAAFGARVLADALAEPMRAIAKNAGIDPSLIVHLAREEGDTRAYDVVRREWVAAFDAGLVDPLPVITTALSTGVSVATMALTTDVLIRHKNPTMATNP